MDETESAVQQEIEKVLEKFKTLSTDSQRLVRFGIGLGIEIAARVQEKVGQ